MQWYFQLKRKMPASVHVGLGTRVSHRRERKKSGDGEDRIRDLTQTESIDAKRALYQLSYVPLLGILHLTPIRSP